MARQEVVRKRGDVVCEGCRVLEFPRVNDARGNLTFIEGGRHIPFTLARVYYLYDVPGGEARGGHAHLELEQVLIAASGSFDIITDDGQGRRKWSLNRSYYGLYIPPLVWREMENFSSGSVCLVLASTYYNEAEYIRNYKDFQRVVVS